MAPPLRKSKYRFLDNAQLENIVAESVPLEGVFQLTKPRFEPLTGNDVPCLGDGEKPTAVGKAVMEWWGKVNDEDWMNCPTDLVRAIEAVSASNSNVTRIHQATKDTARWERNHAGTFSAVTIDVLVPAIGPATVQPRENTHYGRRLRDEYDLPLIHEIGDDLEIIGQSAEHFERIRLVQNEVIEPGSYVGDRQEFVDSLALEGIREPLRGFTYRLATIDGQSGRYVETNDGYTRVAVAQHLISSLLGLPAHHLSRLPWDNKDGTQSVRAWSAERIRELHEALNFTDALFDVWPENETSAGVTRWLNDASPHAEAVMRLMTARMSIGIKIKPSRRHSTHDVVYADMARFHVKGHQPTPWKRNDDEAFKARTIVSNLNREGFIDDDERDVFLGSKEVPWTDDSTRLPYRNRLVATIDTMSRLVVDDPSNERYSVVRRILKSLQIPISPTQAASAAASLAVQVAGLEASGEVGGFTAMIRRSFTNPSVRRLAIHEGDWTAQIRDDLKLIVNRARTELESVHGTNSHAEYLGPNMRALALLAMVGHGMNPTLTEYRKSDGKNADGTERTVRQPSSMTVTGRGARAGATAADAHTVVFHMARSSQGIDQLEAIVRAVTDHPAPIIPSDPESGEPLLEDTLRITWGRNPDSNGKPRASTSQDEFSEGERDIDEVLTKKQWDHQVNNLREHLRGMAGRVGTLAQLLVGRHEMGMDPNDAVDPDDDSIPRMITFFGVDDATAQGYDEDVETIRRFFTGGLLAWFRNRSQS